MLMLTFWPKQNCYEKKKDALPDISKVGSEVNLKKTIMFMSCHQNARQNIVYSQNFSKFSSQTEKLIFTLA